ncbi:MAG TPA: caspase family protein [Pyrinomonadaceae bacterium]|nr:caspase family protein [Pyrinomonadaceae bacterium]
MKPTRTLLLVALSAAAIFAPAPRAARTAAPAASPQAAPGGQKFALVVGINDYVHSTKTSHAVDALKPLTGAENDARDVRDLLVKDFGFTDDAAHVRMLLSMKKGHDAQSGRGVEPATRDNILGGLRELAKKAEQNPGATVVFFYSGHGSHKQDEAPLDEADGRDEAIVPADARQKGVHDILDDELEPLIARIAKARPANLTLIFDSCNSGTISRGDAVVKAAPPEQTPATSRQAPAGAPAAASAATPASNDGYADPSADYVLLSGSRPEYDSYELSYVENARPNGRLTYYMLQALRESPGATYRELRDRVANITEKLINPQTPQAEGEIDRPFLGGAGERRKTPVKILSVAGNRVTLSAGKPLGLREGALVAVYSEKSKTLTGDAERIAQGHVETPGDASSTAVLSFVEPGVTADALKRGSAVIVSPTLGTAAKRVAFDTSARPSGARPSSGARPDAGAKVLERLKVHLTDVPSLKLSEVDAPLLSRDMSGWDVVVARATYAEFLKAAQDTCPKKDGLRDAEDGFYLSKGDGRPMFCFWVGDSDAPAAAAELSKALQFHATQEDLRSLTNEVSTFRGDVKMNLYGAQVTPRPGRAPDIKPRGEPLNKLVAVPELRVGDYFFIEVKNESKEDLYIYLYELGTSGRIQLKTTTLGPDQTLGRGKSLPEMLLYELGPPLGVESFVLIASKKKIDTPQMWEQAGFAFRSAKGDESPLDRLMRQAATRTRDANQPKYNADDWATARVDFLTVAAPPSPPK